MISLLIITIVAIGMISAAGYAAFSLAKAVDNIQLVQRNAAAMDALAAVVKANLRAVAADGVAYAPMGSAAPEGYTTLPSWISAGSRTPWGASYSYCPYAPSSPVSAASASVVQGNGVASYDVETTAWPGVGGASRSYVTASAALPGGLSGTQVVALIVSPPLNSAAVPNCEQVAYGNGVYTVPGGTVVAVSRAVSEDEAAAAAAATVERWVAPAATGDGRGLDPANRMGLADALAQWKALVPQTTVLRLGAGTYTLTAAQADLTATQRPVGSGRRLVLRGAGRTATLVAASDATLPPLRIPVDAELVDVGLGGFEVLPSPATSLTLTNADVGQLVALGADVLVNGATSVSTSGAGRPAIRVEAGRLRLLSASLTASAGASNPLIAQNAEVVLSGGSASFGGADGVVVDGGSFAASGTTLSFSATAAAGINVRKGDLSFRSLGATFAVPSGADGVFAGAGSRFSAEGATLTMASANASSVVRAAGFGASLAQTGIAITGSALVGVALASGHLDLTNATVGSAAARPLVGVNDVGGAHVTGAGTSVWAAAGGACFNGVLFPGTYAAGDAANMAVAGTHLEAANRAAWACQF